jgi:hypothetical protein
MSLDIYSHVMPTNEITATEFQSLLELDVKSGRIRASH